MANRPAPALVLRGSDREKLEPSLRSRSVKAGLVKRARIVLLAADGAESRGVVGFEVILGAYSLLLMAAMAPLSLSG
jgi:hypothetical protein